MRHKQKIFSAHYSIATQLIRISKLIRLSIIGPAIACTSTLFKLPMQKKKITAIVYKMVSFAIF